jgi:hypothetical protein
VTTGQVAVMQVGGTAGTGWWRGTLTITHPQGMASATFMAQAGDPSNPYLRGLVPPDWPFLEAALDWWLIYQTRAELLELVGGLRDVAEAHVRTEPTGSLHLLVARKTGRRA